ncbi:hypothetical protein MHH85_10830 [Viridibacillus sp. FSL E2-0187]|uniref:hypothetical protein n=1 Tax=Viridibacillus TaxID=496496 RepID=UPI0030F6BA58
MQAKDKKFYVNVIFNGGKNFDFYTNTDIRKSPRIEINGAQMAITEEEYCINMRQVQFMFVEDLMKGR